MCYRKIENSRDFAKVSSRDYLWKIISKKRTNISSRVLDEQITTAYINLLTHFPETRDLFLLLFQHLNEAEEEISSSFLDQTQKDILGFESNNENYTSAELGNKLRTTAIQHNGKLITKTSKIIAPVKSFLFDIISKTNKQILLH